MKVVIDKIEQNIAICQRLDNKEILEITADKLPQHAKESDVLIICNQNVIIDKEYTEKRKQELKTRMKNKWK